MEIYNGAVDTQTPEQKARNFNQMEFVASPAPVTWEEKPSYCWKKNYIRDQANSSTCVAQTLATELGILARQKYGVDPIFSASFPYLHRKYPDILGCTSEDVYSIFPEIGDVFEHDMPSQKLSEKEVSEVSEMPYVKDIAKVFRAARISLPIDFERVASTIEATNKGVMVWFRFSPSEWTDIPKLSPNPPTSGHSVTAVDYTLKEGKKYLIVQDSWGLDKAISGLRLISEEYFNARCYLASYLMNFKMDEAPLSSPRPHFDGTIVSAQRCFQAEGFFPLNIPTVENWGNITRSACVQFQKRYGIIPAVGNFGPLTKEKLKQLYP